MSVSYYVYSWYFLYPEQGDVLVLACCLTDQSSIDMYNNDVGKKSAPKIMKQTGDLKAATLYFAS
jgi:hypothetical protein